MALLAMEGFELYGTGAHAQRRLGVQGGGSTSIVAGRGGVGNAFRRTGNAISPYPGLSFSPSNDTIIVGIALYNPTSWGAITSTAPAKFLIFFNPGGGVVGILTTSNGFLGWGRGGGYTISTTVVATSSVPLPLSTWVYIEAKVRLHASAGTVDFQVNGIPAGSFSGLNTASNFSIARIEFVNPTGSTNAVEAFIDDWYVLDGSGSRLNDFLGDVRVMRAALVGEQQAQWARNTGASNLAAINDAAPDDDATYTFSNTPGQRDLYNVGALSAAQVHAVDIRSLQRKEDAGSGAIRLVGRVGAQENLSGLIGVGQNYEYRNHLLTVNPATGQPFTAENLADLAIGYELAGT